MKGQILFYKHRKFSSFAIILVLLCVSTIPCLSAAPSDIENHWANALINQWVDKGYIKGYPDGTFKPNGPITRAEFMTIVNNALGFTEKADSSFTDVEAGSWYANEVAKAKAAGYVSGYPDGGIHPNNPITRQEAAVILSKLCKMKPEQNNQLAFSDTIPEWSKGFVGIVTNLKFMRGYPDGTFGAEKNITRAEAVACLNNTVTFLDKIMGLGNEPIPTPAQATTPTPMPTAITTPAAGSGSSGGGSNSGSNTNTETNTITETISNLNGGGLSQQNGAGTAYDVTLVIYDFAKVVSKFKNVTEAGLKSGANSLAVKVSDKEYVFVYNTDTKDLQVAFSSPQDLTKVIDGLAVYVKNK